MVRDPINPPFSILDAARDKWHWENKTLSFKGARPVRFFYGNSDILAVGYSSLTLEVDGLNGRIRSARASVDIGEGGQGPSSKTDLDLFNYGTSKKVARPFDGAPILSIPRADQFFWCLFASTLSGPLRAIDVCERHLT